MKKAIFAVVLILILVSVTGLRNHRNTAFSFSATVLESQTDRLLVEVTDADMGFTVGTPVYVFLPKGEPTAVYYAGQRILVQYDGMIRETYPPQIDAINIELPVE